MDQAGCSQIKLDIENFVKRKLEKLEKITLLEIILDPFLQALFREFIQRGQTVEMQSTILLERFLLCDKIIHNPDLMNNTEKMENLIEKCTTYEQELIIQNLKTGHNNMSNCLYEIETLKWKTLIDLICERDYKQFLNAIKNKSSLIEHILVKIYLNRL